MKVDFFPGDKQVTMELYEDILSDANRHGLQVIFHGCTLPRGWERLYPNFVASEAVLASENVYFNEGSANRQPFDLTLHPFCRNALASMDWGGIIMNRYLSRDNKSRHSRKTTDTFEMASGIIMQTSVQCVAIYPNNLNAKEIPEVEIEFLKELPTTWNETVFIDGYPGKFVILARKSAGKWYVSGLNGESNISLKDIPLPTGINDIVIYDADAHPLASRLFFVNNHDMGTKIDMKMTTDAGEVGDKTILKPYQKVDFELLSATNASSPKTYSIAIRDARTDDCN